MKNTFYRPEDFKNDRELDVIVKKLKEDFNEVVSEKCTKEELKEYVEKLVADAKPFAGNEDKLFWGVAEPVGMPADCRVAYFYNPTYYATAIMVSAFLQYTEFAREIKGFEDTLHKALNGSAGRSFKGAGYNTFKGVVECLDIFLDAKIQYFIATNYGFSEEFQRKYFEATNFIINIYKGNIKLHAWDELKPEKLSDFINKLVSGDK